MSVEQTLQYVGILNTLFVNKVITRSEFREALKRIALFTEVCKSAQRK